MSLDRREFLCALAASGLAGHAGTSVSAGGLNALKSAADGYGVLVDLPNCIGCRKCEFACREAAGFEVPAIESFEDKSVMRSYRRPTPGEHTVVNAHPNGDHAGEPVYAKINCLHCLEPACASACLVGALQKTEDGPVIYDADKCMGCRYCMVACPFQIPTYEFDNALTPQVRKCTFCADRLAKGDVPACVGICPRECLVFGRRRELLALAREKIAREPDTYINHIYGEHEAGGTSWLYLSSVPFESLDFVQPGDKAPGDRTESIQHGVFKFFVPPLALYGLLGLVMWLAKPAHGGLREATPASVNEHPITAHSRSQLDSRSPAGNGDRQ